MSPDILLGKYYGATDPEMDPDSSYAWANSNLGHIDVTVDDPDHSVTLMLDLAGPQDEVDALVAELLSRPSGTEYLWSSDSHPFLSEYGYDLLLQFPSQQTTDLNFTWHFSGSSRGKSTTNPGCPGAVDVCVVCMGAIVSPHQKRRYAITRINLSRLFFQRIPQVSKP